jgi:hypothetical protein
MATEGSRVHVHGQQAQPAILMRHVTSMLRAPELEVLGANEWAGGGDHAAHTCTPYSYSMTARVCPLLSIPE